MQQSMGMQKVGYNLTELIVYLKTAKKVDLKIYHKKKKSVTIYCEKC